jgi:hypothetical protein
MGVCLLMQKFSSIKSLVWNIFASGISQGTDFELLRKVILLNIMLLIGSLAVFIFGIFNWINGSYAVAIADIISFIVFVVFFVYLRFVKRVDFVGTVLAIYMGAFFLFLLIGGAETTYIWIFSFPLVAVFLLGINLGGILSLILLGIMSFVLIVEPAFLISRYYPDSLKTRMIPLYILILFFVSIMEIHRLKVFEILSQTRRSLNRSLVKFERSTNEKEKLITQLEQNLKEVGILQGFLPICASCKKIRDDDGYWNKVEHYMSEHTDVTFEQGICPDCSEKRT